MRPVGCLLTATLTLFAAAKVAPSVVYAQGDRAALEARLNKAGGALSAGEASAMGRRETQLLFAIVDDRAGEAVLRARATTTLGLVRSAAAHDFLENLIIRKLPSSDPTDRLLLRKAAVALGWQSGPRVVDTLAPLLEHGDPEVRLDAAVGLGLTRNQAALQPLRDRLTREDDANVRRQLETQLRLLTETLAPAAPPVRPAAAPDHR